jgi:hypothetical protein
MITSLQQTSELAGLGRSRAVGGAAALAFAAVLPRIGAAALALAIVLALAGVFGGVGSGVALGNQHSGDGRGARGGGAVLLGRLCVQASSCAAEQACKCSSECEGICGMVLHK